MTDPNTTTLVDQPTKRPSAKVAWAGIAAAVILAVQTAAAALNVELNVDPATGNAIEALAPFIPVIVAYFKRDKAPAPKAAASRLPEDVTEL